MSLFRQIFALGAACCVGVLVPVLANLYDLAYGYHGSLFAAWHNSDWHYSFIAETIAVIEGSIAVGLPAGGLGVLLLRVQRRSRLRDYMLVLAPRMDAGHMSVRFAFTLCEVHNPTIQGHSSPFKPIQALKKIVIFLAAPKCQRRRACLGVVPLAGRRRVAADVHHCFFSPHLTAINAYSRLLTSIQAPLPPGVFLIQ